LGDPVTLGRALLSFRFSGGPFDIEERTACGHELIALGDVTGLEVFACAGRQQLWWCAREMGDVDEMDRWYESAREHVKGRDVEQLSHEAIVALLRGDLDRARDLTDDLAEFARGLRLEEVYVPLLRQAISDCRGRTPDVERMRRLTATLHGRTGALMRALLADSCARTGLLAEAQALLDDARKAGFAEYSMCVEWLMVAAWWAETAALTGDVAAAAELVEIMQPLAGRLADGGMVVIDSIDRVRALVMLTVGDVEGATDTARRAVTASRSRNMPIMLGRELLVLATARRRGGTGLEDVDALVTEALKIADRTGARIIDHDAERFELAAPTRPPPHPDQLGLTPREREVLELLATGADNRQIATELDIALSTVRKHLEHAYAKLNVSTRTGAVARIRQHLGANSQ
jgi:ATP/maltotriose-dependent transcriptional regulator MalT